jgi:hypothetical protein
VPEKEIKKFREKGLPYNAPEPRIINCVVYPDNSCVYMARTGQGYGYFGGGHGPAYAEGVRMEPWPDDGSKQWADLFARAQQHPVRARWQVR